MNTDRGRLAPQRVPVGIELITPDKASAQVINEDSPAISVMTDLSVVTPFHIEPEALINDANSKMIACGVRLLFVLDKDEKLTGLVTSTDILGEKPMKFIAAHGGSYQDISVQDVMTPLEKLEAVPLEKIERISVGDLVDAIQNCRRHHMLVLESRNNRNSVRGIISITQVGRQLGRELCPSMRADSFAKLNKALT